MNDIRILYVSMFVFGHCYSGSRVFVVGIVRIVLSNILRCYFYPFYYTIKFFRICCLIFFFSMGIRPYPRSVCIWSLFLSVGNSAIAVFLVEYGNNYSNRPYYPLRNKTLFHGSVQQGRGKWVEQTTVLRPFRLFCVMFRLRHCLWRKIKKENALFLIHLNTTKLYKMHQWCSD